MGDKHFPFFLPIQKETAWHDSPSGPVRDFLFPKRSLSQL